ncbi:MAG TPA: glycosyltransferase family protein [Thermoanaerobaculia bacterium]
MKLLYGVVGEGMGHAVRSRVVLEHLLARGHEIEIMASGRAADFLAARFRGVRRIHGFHIVYGENQMRLAATVGSNLVSTAAGLPKNISAWFDVIREFAPETVISDFDSWTYLYGKAHGLPVISIDNQQIVHRCRHPPEVVAGHELDFQLTRTFVGAKLPFCLHYVVTTFFFPEIRKPQTTLVPPILRPEVLATPATRGDHLLVYQTAEGNTGLARTLAGTGMECRIYGMRRGISEEQVEGNLRYRPFDEAGFIADLASARAVICGGGFTVLGEAVYLRKPTLSVPVRGQFEQVLNARWLERLGYGRYAESLQDPTVVHRFLEAIPGCEEKLASYRQDGNERLYEVVDRLVSET